MKKRIISALLGAALLIGFVMPCLGGCSTAQNENNYTITQWLDMVETSFNLLYYSEQEPLVSSIKASDERFDTVQIAAEWGIIDPSDDLKFNDKLTKEFAADTLIRAMNCATPSSVEMSDSDKVKPLYLENVMTSVNEGIFGLENNNFEPKKQLTKAEADNAILTAFDKWVNFSYGGESYDKSVVKENVINFGGVTSENSTVTNSDYHVEYTGSRTFFDESGGYTDNTGKTITFPAGQVPASLAVDTVLAMPADDVVPMNYAVVVTGVTTNDDGSVTVTTRNAELEEVFEEIDVQQSGPVDFSEAVFYGPDGQRIYFDDEAADMSDSLESENENLGIYRVGEENIVEKAAKKNSSTISLGDNLSLTLSSSLGGGKGSLGIKIKGSVKSGEAKTSVEFGFDETISVENKLKTHWDWFKLKVDELRFCIKDEKKETFGFSHSSVESFGKIQNKVNERGDGFQVGDWAKEGHKLRKIYGDTQKVGQSFKQLKSKAEAATNKKLLDIIIPSTNLHFVIRAELSVEGSLKLTLTQSTKVGVELVKGKLRPITEGSNTKKLDFSAKAELTLRLGLEYQLVGIDVADVGFKAGIGSKVGSVIYSFDKATDSLAEVCGIEGAAVFPGKTVNASDDVQIAESGLPIQTDDTREDRVCLEVTTYPIGVAYLCSSSSVAGKIFSPIELTIWDDSTPWFKVHYELDENGGGVVSECTVTANENYGIETGDKLTLNTEEHVIPVSEEANTSLAVVTLPKNATIKDITIVSDNTDVLTVENLLNKATVSEGAFPKGKWDITVGNNKYLKKYYDGSKLAEINLSERKYQIGSWFYEEVSKDKKPQFALTGKKDGMANVTISVGSQSVTIPVQVGTGFEPVESTGALISDKSTYILAPGDSVQTAFSFIPEGKSIADITFTSSDSSIAAVTNGGKITAVGEGSTMIQASLNGEKGQYTYAFTVHVYAELAE